MNILLNPKFILTLIIINSLTIFIQGFNISNEFLIITLEFLDAFITILFVLEIIVKVKYLGFKKYFKSNWNKFDFSLVLISLPSLFTLFTSKTFIELDFLLTLRVLRVFKFFRVLKFIPNVEKLFKGIYLALKSSIFIVLTFFIFNFIFAIISFFLYSKILPEYFENPIISFYSTFKIFTVEGWYEIPDLIAEKTNNTSFSIFTKIYFILLLFGGGIFGLSLINSIFVDSMLADNNDEVLEKIKLLENKIDKLNNKF